MKRSIEKREASYKWGVITAKRERWNAQPGTLEEETTKVEWWGMEGNKDVITKKHVTEMEEAVVQWMDRTEEDRYS